MDSPDSTSLRWPSSKSVRMLAALMGGLAIVVGCVWLGILSKAGFPDGHITQYDVLMKKPLLALSLFSIASGGYFFWLAFRAAQPRSVVGLFVATVSYLLLVPGAYWGLDCVVRHYTQIYHGQGG